ncbi:ERF family protein [Streptomyces umbrinus]|uniref:ERF family protein n=1 Tax=Streptomyces umbrinus TaxID=67370 RepID=UPI0034197A27
MTATTLPIPQAAGAQRVTEPSDQPARVEITYVPAPAGMPTEAPRIFTVLSAAMRDISPVGKNQENTQQRYKFRGVDDVMSAVAGPFRAHGLFILPELVNRTAERRSEKMTSVTVTMRYHVYGPAGDCLVATVPGEASDFADKATNKAQSAAMKYLLVHLFMIPVDAGSVDDGDRDHPVEPPAERAQRQQERRQRGQQRQQQPRRSNRAEPGPWEQPAAQQAAPPRRDFLAEATQAPNREAFDKVRAAAIKAGAPADYLDRLDAVARQKDQALTNNPHRYRAPEPSDQPNQQVPSQQEAPASTPTAPLSAEAAAEQAEQRLRLAASRAGMQSLDADFERAYGVPIAEAGAQQLNHMADMIEKAAQK